jgi:hypothetical protein
MQVKTKRWIRRIVLGGVLAVVAGAGLTVYLLQRPPAVWREAQAMLEETTPVEREALAIDVMKRLAEASEAADGKLRPRDPRAAESLQGSLDPAVADEPIDETFEVELSNEELLAVATDWAEKWIAQRGYQLPEQVDPPVVLMHDGALTIALEIKAGSVQQVLSGKLDVRFDADGMAHGSVKRLTAGSLPMSVTAVGDWLGRQLPESQRDRAEQIGRWVAELEDFAFRPVLELEHRRRARVLSMEMRERSLVMTMRLQDHRTYKTHNTLMKAGTVAVNDALHPLLLEGDAIADVPTTTD